MDVNFKRNLACRINAVISIKRPEALDPKIDPDLIFTWLEQDYHMDIPTVAYENGYKNLIQMLIDIDSVMVLWENNYPLITYSRRYMTPQQNAALTAKRARIIAKEKQNKGKRYPAQPRNPYTLYPAQPRNPYTLSHSDYHGDSTMRTFNPETVDYDSPNYKKNSMSAEQVHDKRVKELLELWDARACEENDAPEFYHDFKNDYGLRHRCFLRPTPWKYSVKSKSTNVAEDENIPDLSVFQLVNPVLKSFRCENHIIKIYSEEEYLKSRSS
uniref:Uncharacterized protein n=1 Tax=Panagrolaimus sp. JU765 TaxID=591449 RepID=A0AC34QYE2_9BILA